jgi:hypothetical protein
MSKAKDLAGLMYAEYCKAVGGKAFNGDPLPSWEEFSNDNTKLKQVTGWIVAAETALIYCEDLNS